MRTKIIFQFLAFIIMISTSGQKPALELTFTAVSDTSYVQLDSIKVMNRTQGNSTLIYWPDTTLTLGINAGDTLLYIGYSTGYPVGINDLGDKMENFQIIQINPNPVKESTFISLYIPEQGTVNLLVADILGREILEANWQMNKGYHSFRFNPGNGKIFFLVAQWKGISRSIKILNMDPGTENKCSLENIESDNREIKTLASSVSRDVLLQSGILDNPGSNKTYTFQFATKIPCPGTPTITYQGQNYNTIQIFSQCWLKENLNVGIMVPGTQQMNNNGVIEKYCYADNSANCVTFGGLYQWDEMMQYTTAQGVEGICPPDWHVPTDEEWKVLEGAVDSEFGIGDPEWDAPWNRGFDVGLILKSTTGWANSGNGTDLFGFSGLPGGDRFSDGYFYTIGENGYWWTSTLGNSVSHYKWSRNLCYLYSDINRLNNYKIYGFGVRCIRNN